MNAYDFDGTIYDGDSTVDFYLYCLKKHPYIILKLPKQLIGILKYKLHLINKLSMKECFYSYFSLINNIDEDVEDFWLLHQIKIKKWYLEKKKEDDLIISASPEFLLKWFCDCFEIKNLIASKVNKITGECNSENCFGIEKVYRYKEQYKNKKIENFYSDSKSDQPMAEIAEQAWLVNKNNIIHWL